jgi:hypothetical protein
MPQVAVASAPGMLHPRESRFIADAFTAALLVSMKYFFQVNPHRKSMLIL